MKKINILESLLELDKSSSNMYELSTLYEACKLSDEDKYQLVKYIDSYEHPSIIGQFLQGKCEGMCENICDDDDVSGIKDAEKLINEINSNSIPVVMNFEDIDDDVEVPVVLNEEVSVEGRKEVRKIVWQKVLQYDYLTDDDSRYWEFEEGVQQGDSAKIVTDEVDIPDSATYKFSFPELDINMFYSWDEECWYVLDKNYEGPVTECMENDEQLDEDWEPEFSDDWNPEDIEKWKSIDWKARNYERFIDDSETIEHDVVAYGLPGGEQHATATFAKEFSANPIFPPQWKPINDPFEGKGTNGWYMYGGHKHTDGYLIADRTETQELSDALSESLFELEDGWTDYCPNCTNRALVGVGDSRVVCDECGAEYEVIPIANGKVRLMELNDLTEGFINDMKKVGKTVKDVAKERWDDSYTKAIATGIKKNVSKTRTAQDLKRIGASIKDTDTYKKAAGKVNNVKQAIKSYKRDNNRNPEEHTINVQGKDYRISDLEYKLNGEPISAADVAKMSAFQRKKVQTIVPQTAKPIDAQKTEEYDDDSVEGLEYITL